MNPSTTTAGTQTWRDGKRAMWLLSPMVPVLGLLLPALAYSANLGVLYWGLPLFLYGVLPLLDVLIGTDRTNPPESAVAELEQQRYYRAIVVAYIPAQYAATILGAWLAVSAGLAWWELLGLVISTGVVNGVAINTAHELGHKTNSLERWLAKLTLGPVAYGHFFIEHNKGHHKNVATPEDPASSKMGENFWVFLPRTMSGSLRSAWELERSRLEKKGRSVWSFSNENLQAWAITVVLFGALTYWLGAWALLFLAAQAFYGMTLLEVVNYLEHYGLVRLKDQKTGRYERCQPRHSWNSNHVVTNLFLYQLQRHSDHHANPTRRYQALRHFDDSPQLPSGYASMLLIAYFPPIWFRVMDPLVVAHHQGDLTKANVYPPRRAELIAKWAAQVPPVGSKTFEFVDDAPVRIAATAKVKTSQHQCPNCSYIYDESVGCPREGVEPGTPWSALPNTWPCPDCAVREKIDFHPLETAVDPA
jgi:alkane 1-monooxygenase